MSTLPGRQKHLAVLSFLLFVFLLAAYPLHAQYVTTTVPAGTNPWAVAVNPVTNKIYVANYSTNNVTVIDGATNTTATVTDPAAISPYAVAVDTMTNKIYVANCGTCASSTGVGSGSVTVIDGATNTITNLGLGFNPWAVAVNPVTNKIYVANCGNCGGGTGKGNVMVIDGATNTTTTITDRNANGPTAVAVNPATNKIYVTNVNSNTVSVINGATHGITSVAAGSSPGHIAVNPVTNTIYVANGGSGTVTVINGATNSKTTVTTGGVPAAVAVNPVSNKIYVANCGVCTGGSNIVTVIDGATNAATAVSAGTDPWDVAVNPVTNKVYVSNNSGSVTVIDGATNSTTTLTDPNAINPYAVAVNPVTNKVYVGNELSANVTVIDGATNATTTVTDPNAAVPYAVAVNPVTNKIYVPNQSSSNVTVIDGATNSTTTVSAGNSPWAVDVNPVTNKIYVANLGGGVTVIDGATNATTTVNAGGRPYGVAVNQVTNKVYVPNVSSNNVTVIDGATNTTVTVTDPSPYAYAQPYAVAVNPVTNKIYVPNSGANSVMVIDGATNSTTMVSAGVTPVSVAVNPVTNKIYVVNNGDNSVTVIEGATNSTTTVGVGAGPWGIAVNPVTNKIYVAGSPVTVIDGATNSTTTVGVGSVPEGVAVNPVSNKIYVTNGLGSSVTVIDGVTNSTVTVSAGTYPYAVAVNPVTNKIYVANGYGGGVTVIDEAQVQPIPLVTAITPLTDNQTVSPTPTFDFSASSSFSPTAPTPQAVWYQVDAWQGSWLPTSGATPNFSAATSSLSLGTHILYAFATDGQDANSTGVAQPLIGSMAAYLFDVVLPSTTTTLASSPNPSNYGQAVTFTATVAVNPPFSGTPTGTVGFYADGGFLGSSTLAANGQAVYTTTALPGGSLSMNAIYSGDTNFLESTSPVLTQQVIAYPAVTLSPTSLQFENRVIGTTSAARRVTLTNSGHLTMNISSIVASANFAVFWTNCGATLAIGASCTVYVTFTPTVPGKLTGTLTFTDNAFDNPQTVALSGIGVEPATLTLPKFTYPAQAVNTTSLPHTFTLTNYQTVGLNTIVISTTGDFAVSSTTCTTSLAAKSHCTISVTFTPTALGTRTGQLNVSDDASNTPQTSALTGTGVIPATLTPGSATYTSQTVGTTSPARTFALSNNQTVALNSIVTSTTGDFAVSSTTCTTNLAAKSKCTINVTFTPTTTGKRTGQLSVSDDASNNPQTSNLTGSGK